MTAGKVGSRASGADLYSTLKPAWHLDRIEVLREGRVPAPVHVQMILSDLCNQDCGFCAYRMSSGLSNELFGTADTRNPNRKMPTQKALEIIEDCANLGVKAIQFTGGGEPTVHKDHLPIFERAQQLGMKTALVTNGVKLDPEHPAIRNMEWVRVSIDAGTPETYARIRCVSDVHWFKTWENITKLSHSCRGVVSIGFVLTPDNYREVSFAAALARSVGVRNMRIGAVFSTEGRDYYQGLEDEIREHIAAAKALETEAFTVVDLFDRRIGDLDDGSPTEPLCGYQYLTTYIGGDLGVYRCCNTAYTRVGKVADLHHTRFRDLFTAQSFPAFDARQCRYCQFIGQNKILAALVKEPAHVEFV